MQVAEGSGVLALRCSVCRNTKDELLTRQCLCKVLVLVFLEQVFTYVMAAVFVSPNKSIIFYLVLVFNLQGSQRVFHRWHLKGSLLIMLKLNSNMLYIT